jgi:hypothetical protein
MVRSRDVTVRTTVLTTTVTTAAASTTTATAPRPRYHAWSGRPARFRQYGARTRRRLAASSQISGAWPDDPQHVEAVSFAGPVRDHALCALMNDVRFRHVWRASRQAPHKAGPGKSVAVDLLRSSALGTEPWRRFNVPNRLLTASTRRDESAGQKTD